MQLDVRDEPMVPHIGCKCYLQCQNALMGDVPLLLGVVPSGEATVQRIQVEHGSEPNVGTAFLPEQSSEVVPHRLVVLSAAPGDEPVPPPARRQHRPHHLHSEPRQVRPQHSRDVPLLRLAFDVEVEPDHQYGPPPITFRSHSSLSVYCSNQSFSPLASSRSNVELPSRRLTVKMSSTSKWSISAADWVAMNN